MKFAPDDMPIEKVKIFEWKLTFMIAALFIIFFPSCRESQDLITPLAVGYISTKVIKLLLLLTESNNGHDDDLVEYDCIVEYQEENNTTTDEFFGCQDRLESSDSLVAIVEVDWDEP